MQSIQDLLFMSHNNLVIKILLDRLDQIVTITMVTGEKITGMLDQFNREFAYIRSEQNFTKEELERAEKRFGREHVEKMLATNHILLIIPIEDIQSIC